MAAINANPLDELVTSSTQGDAPPAALLPYQQRWIADQSPLKVYEKSRRIGLTWAEASDDVLIAAAQRGTNVFYIGPTEDMAFDYIEACGMWARAFNQVAGEVQDFLFEDIDAAGDTKYIKAYRIDFPGSGKRIVALSSRPKNLRGKQGIVVIDEAAFHDDLYALLKAAMAMLLWGDRVRVLSTHNGADNQFNELIQEIRSGKRKGSVHHTTFAEAVSDGLYQRVCLRRGLKWSQDDQDAWVKDAYAFYGEASAEELDVVPSQGGGAYFTIALIESCMSAETPIVRRTFSAEFNAMPEPARRAEVSAWCAEELKSYLSALDKSRWHAFGQDFGRTSNGTTIIVGEEAANLKTRVRLIVELWNCPFSQQEQILFFIGDNLGRLRGGALDATGNGASLAEKAADKYGGTRIHQVKLSESFYLENFPTLKGAMEDGSLCDIPKDADIRDDFRAVRLVNGVPKLPSSNTKGGGSEKGKATRHGEAAIAAMMLHFAMKRDVVDISGIRTSGDARVGYGLADFLFD